MRLWRRWSHPCPVCNRMRREAPHAGQHAYGVPEADLPAGYVPPSAALRLTESEPWVMPVNVVTPSAFPPAARVLDGSGLYEAYREAGLSDGGTWPPDWNDLSARKQARWAAVARAAEEGRR